MPAAVDLGIANDGQRASRKQTAQIAIALFADIAEALLARARMLLRHKPDPSRKVSPRSESLRVSDAGNQGGGQRRSHAGNLVEPLACLAGAMPSHDQTIELQNLRLQHMKLGAESGDACTCDLGQALVGCIRHDIEQLVDTFASDRRDDPKLGKVGADRIDHRSLLTDKEM